MLYDNLCVQVHHIIMNINKIQCKTIVALLQMILYGRNSTYAIKKFSKWIE